jgi:hypothetical protein
VATTTTTTPPAPYRFIAPATAGIGSNFPLLVTGATGGGRVDFVVDGIMPLGSVNIDGNGEAGLSGAVWGPGVVTIEAIWTQFVAGVPTVRTQSARVAIF